jgi:hypothetical protein
VDLSLFVAEFQAELERWRGAEAEGDSAAVAE